MNTDINFPHRNEGINETHHCHHTKKSKFKIFISIIEKISAVALGAFSLYTCWQLFVPFFLVGACIGIYSYVRDKNTCRDNHPGSSCAHGLLEDLTGVKLPPIISTIANIAVTICHIDHHANVFVPIIGLSLGNWIGKTVSHFGVLAYKKGIAPLFHRPAVSTSTAT